MNGSSIDRTTESNCASELLERELTCPICTELLFDPVTFLNCLHTNCGSCAKKWFTRSSPTTPSCTSPAIQSCPICRKRVRAWRTNPMVTTLLDGYLALHPEKRRSEEEMMGMREIWSPGDELLPPGILAGPGEDGNGEVGRGRETGDGSTGEPPRRRMTAMQMVLHQRARPPSRTIATEPNSPSSPTFPITILAPSSSFSRRRASTSTPSTPRPNSPSNAIQRRMSRTPSPRDPPDPNAPPPPPPTSVLEILHRGINPIIITCDSCATRLDSTVHHECAVCPLFHLCLRCSLTTAHPHPLHRQKLNSIWPRRNLITGIFCDVCDTWCDEDRNENSRLGSAFFQCETCNGGCWAYCLRCVQRGWSCTHELMLWSNVRRREVLGSPLLRGNPAAVPMTRILKRLDYRPWEPLNGCSGASSSAVSISSSSGSIGSTGSTARSSTPTVSNSTTVPASSEIKCNICHLPIPPTSSLLHCFACPDDAAAMCTTCYYNLHRTFPDQKRAIHRFFECANGHNLSVLAVPGKPVTHRAVGAMVSRPRLPEWVSASGASTGRRAIAVRGYWPDEGVDAAETSSNSNSDLGGRGAGNGEHIRRWGFGQWLCFPEGAEVWDVVRVFGREEGGGVVENVLAGSDGWEPGSDRRWCWGSFAGTAGLFPEECITFV